MLTEPLRKAVLAPVARTMGLGLSIGLGIGLGFWLLTPPPLAALPDTQLYLTGGQSTAGDPDTPSVRYVAPGTLFNNSIDFPGTGLGEMAVQMPMRQGRFKRLDVNLTTQNVPASGTFTLMVRRNGVDTAMSCSLTVSGTCSSTNNVAFNNGAKLSLKWTNSMDSPGNSQFTYVLVYD